MKGKTWVILLGIAAGTAFASYAISKKDKKSKQNIANDDAVKNEVVSGGKGRIKEITEAESFFI